MNLDGTKEKMKIHFPCSFFHLLLFLCLLLYALSSWEGSCRPWDLQLCLFLPKVITALLLFNAQVFQWVFPETLSLETLSTILGSSVGIGLLSEGWSSWLHRLFLCRASMVLQLIKLHFFRALQGKSLLGSEKLSFILTRFLHIPSSQQDSFHILGFNLPCL